jgi:hypothetical protein
MDPRSESTNWSEWAGTVEPWVLPAITAVVVVGVLLLSTLIGMFWLATRPLRQPIVILMPPAVEREQPADVRTDNALEKRLDVRTN